ncbi:NAD-P-binding protein [Lenzites betulinus]|nr:NAD-P-binding protein [Lenzites betulinus]
MAPVTNGRLLFNEVPVGYPVAGKTTVYDVSQTIDLESAPLNGGFLVKTLVLSIDPYLRGRMRDASVKSYSPPFPLHEPITNFGVGVVLRSENPAIKVGQHIYGIFAFQQYFIAAEPTHYKVIENKEGLPWSVYLGVCGMPGETADYAWKEFSKAKKGEVAFVTSASGPVGATVVQIAKAAGMKVIASAGSDEKVDFVRSLGADVAFNYKTQNTHELLEKEGPIDVFWDNVGGETLEAALDHANRHARFIECGMISQYNTAPYYVKNLMKIVAQELSVHGFIVGTLRPKYVAEFYQTFPARVASGEIRYKEDRVQGLERAGDALVDVLRGNNFGKSVVIVADE